MDTITSLFTGIGDVLNATSWFPSVQWTFWTMLIVLAFCGIHTARFGKRKLVTLAFQGALKLAIFYMIVAALYIWARPIMTKFSELPFFSHSDEGLALVNPLGLLDRWNTALPRVVVRLYFLLFFINGISVFDYQTPNFIGWFTFQIIFGAFAVFCYSAVSTAIMRYWPGGPDLFYVLMAILILVVFLLILALKFVFTFILTGGNNTYQNVYRFLTEVKFGQLFTISALSFLIVIGYLVIAALTGHNRLEYDSVSIIAFLLNGTMCTLTLHVFNRYYNGA